MIVILQKSQPEELLLHGRMVVVSVIINRNCIGPLVLMSGWLYGRIYENEFITKLILVMFVKMLTNSYSCILWYSDGYCFLLVFFLCWHIFGKMYLVDFVQIMILWHHSWSKSSFLWRFWKICKILQSFCGCSTWCCTGCSRRCSIRISWNFLKYQSCRFALIQMKITEDHWHIEDNILPDLRPSFATI